MIPTKHVKEIQHLFRSLKVLEKKQDALREKESVIRIRLQRLYNQQSQNGLDKKVGIS